MYLARKSPNSSQRNLWPLFLLLGEPDEALLVRAAVVSVQYHHEGPVGACFPPAWSLSLSLPLACGLHYQCAVISIPVVSSSTSLISKCLDSSALPLIYFRICFFCSGFPLALFLIGHVFVYVCILLVLEGSGCMASDLYFLTCRLPLYCVWRFDRSVWIPFLNDFM